MIVFYEIVISRGQEMNRLTEEEIRQRQQLTLRLKDGSLTNDEAQQLREILEKEKIIAQETHDLIALGAIIFLLGAVIYFLSKDDEKKKKKSKRFIFF